jgi:non-ribosomal peptide synthetase component F
MHALLPPSCRVLNLYGSTEVAADCTCQELPAPAARWSDPLPVGRPVCGSLVAVLLPLAPPGAEAAAGAGGAEALALALQLARPGEVGEVAVGGCGLAQGYVQAPEAAAGRFILVPTRVLRAGLESSRAVAAAEDLPPGFWEARVARLLRTGDLGRLDERGRLTVLGRTDLQAKIAGGPSVFVVEEQVPASPPAHRQPAGRCTPARVFAEPAWWAPRRQSFAL